jgi:Na+-transporting NADH:ubiquinone oxidoreductase subunit B
VKLFSNILSKIKPHFEDGGKLKKFWPAYDAFETFLFVPSHTTKQGVHIRDAVDLKRTMVTVIIALIPALLFGMWNIGQLHFNATGQTEFSIMDAFLFGSMKVMPLILVSYIVGLTIEFAFAVYRGHSVNEGYLVTGLLIPMVMPVDVPLWMVAVSVAFAVVIGKEVFGGTGMNILNPALTARAFLFFAYPTKMSGDEVWIHTGGMSTVDGFSGATPLADLAANIPLDISLIGSFFVGNMAGSVSETSTLAILIGAAILIITGVGSWRTMISVFVGGYIMGLLFNLWGANEYMNLPAHIHLLLGGFAFGAVFMATDPVTASQTNKGKLIVGFLIGILAILIRVFNPAYPEGMMMAILLMNVFAPLVDHYIIQSNIARRLKRIKSK